MDPILDDYEGFKQLDQVLSRIGFSDLAKAELYAIVASVLHLGNVTFEEIPNAEHDGCQVSTSSENALIFASKLIGVDSFELRQALVSRAIQSKSNVFNSTAIK